MPIEALFVDVGGVLGSNGWGRDSRKLACQTFGLDEAEVDERHRMTFDAYEVGKLTLPQYLDRIVFYQPRPFTQQQFIEFMYGCSKPYPDMLEFVAAIKKKYSLKVIIVSNEGRELTLHRVDLFQLRSLADAFLFSCFVHFRKPDPDIFQLALNISLVPPANTLYVDDRPLFVEVAQSYGMHGWVQDHNNMPATRDAFAALGLSL